MVSTIFKIIMSFGWNKRILRCAALSVLLCRALTAGAQDQKPELAPIYSYQLKGGDLGADMFHYPLPYDYRWMPNNVLLIEDVMHGTQSDEAIPFSVAYDPYAPRGTAQSLVLSTLPTSSTPLPSNVQMLPLTFRTVFATSPDGRFDLYHVAHYYKDDNDAYLSTTTLGIVDRTTGRFTTLANITPAYAHNITWSDNNKAFVLTFIGAYGDGPYYAYVTDFADDVTKARGTMLSGWGDIADKLQWGIYQLYDMDSTGRYLLADGYLYNADFEQGNMRLLVLDMEDLSYEIVASQGYFSGGGFVQPDNQHVLYVGATGVFAYDREAKTSTLLTDEINSSEILMGYYQEFYPEFSPDGHYLAARLNGDKANTLYVYPIPPLP